MMDYLINNFEVYANTYAGVLIELYLFAVTLLLAYWVRPFVDNRPAAFISAGVYYLLQLINNHMGSGKDTDRLIAIGTVGLGILTAWLLDKYRNPIQKTFLFIVFRLISWLSVELLSEIGFLERDIIFRCDWYTGSLTATVMEFLIWNPIQYIMALLLLYAVIKILHKTYRFKRDELTWQEFVMLLAPAWTLLLVKPIMYSYFRLWMDGMKNGSVKDFVPANPYRVLFCMFAFVSVVTVIVFYQMLKEKQEEDFVRTSVEKQIGDLSGHIEHIEKIYEEMRGLRHDLGNHLTVIEKLAENGNTEELVSYTRDLGVSFERLQPKIKTGNAVTDVILSETASRCEREGILFESAFRYPENIDINPFDMSVILTNALQNAVESAEKIMGSAVRIRSVQRDGVFIINIRNTIDHRRPVNDEGLLESSKHENGHGYGLKNIRSIAAEYKGDIELRQDEIDGELQFILNIMLTEKTETEK